MYIRSAGIHSHIDNLRHKGIGALAFLLWEPHLEGRNANATPYELYFNDPFLAYAYVASVSFFMGSPVAGSLRSVRLALIRDRQQTT